MKQTYTFLTGCCAGLAIGLAFGWAVLIQEQRHKDELGSDLNAYRVMAEWDQFEEGRK